MPKVKPMTSENPRSALTKKQKVVIRDRVEEVRDSLLYAAANRGHYDYDTRGDRKSYHKVFRAEVGNVTIGNSPATVAYKQVEQGSMGSVRSLRGDTLFDYHQDQEVVKERLKVTLNPEDQESVELKFDFQEHPLDEVARLAGSLVLEQEQPDQGLFAKMGVVCEMLETAALAVA